MSAIAAEDFNYKLYLFDDKEMDHSKVHSFKKNDPLPQALVERLEKHGPDYWIKYKDGKSKKDDIPKKVDLKSSKKETKETKKKYTDKELFAMNRGEQEKVLTDLGGTADSNDKEPDLVKKILKLQ